VLPSLVLFQMGAARRICGRGGPLSQSCGIVGPIVVERGTRGCIVVFHGAKWLKKEILLLQ
jgi:hypothetical protein